MPRVASYPTAKTEFGNTDNPLNGDGKFVPSSRKSFHVLPLKCAISMRSPTMNTLFRVLPFNWYGQRGDKFKTLSFPIAPVPGLHSYTYVVL